MGNADTGRSLERGPVASLDMTETFATDRVRLTARNAVYVAFVGSGCLRQLGVTDPPDPRCVAASRFPAGVDPALGGRRFADRDAAGGIVVNRIGASRGTRSWPACSVSRCSRPARQLHQRGWRPVVRIGCCGFMHSACRPASSIVTRRDRSRTGRLMVTVPTGHGAGTVVPSSAERKVHTICRDRACTADTSWR